LTSELWQGQLERIDDFRWRIPKSYKAGMRVPGIIYADDKLLKDIRQDKAVEQVANVAFLPGIVNASLAMPDIHWGYGFPIGGVAATDIENGGVISPGGVGFDINCGVRMLRTNFQYEEIKDKIKDLIYALFSDIPSGVGSKGDIRVSAREEREILVKGSRWAVEKGYGTEDDLERTEESGAIQGADPDAVSIARGGQSAFSETAPTCALSISQAMTAPSRNFPPRFSIERSRRLMSYWIIFRRVSGLMD